MTCHQGIDRGSVVGIEVSATDEVVGQGAGLVAGPGAEGGNELVLIDQAILEASRPKSTSRSAAMAAMGRASREAGTGGERSAPGTGSLRRTRRIGWIIS